MSPAVRTEGLTKYYGRNRGIENVDLEVLRGEVFGFLGPNGAGKTTTLRLLLDFIRPTSGRAEVLGRDARTDGVEIRRRTGYLPGEPAFYEHLTGAELFEHFGHLRGMADVAYRDELIERLGLDPGRKIGELSKGNKQKVAVVQALMHRPDLLILDEPTSGLDPLVRHEFRRILQQTTAEGRTVLLSSHVLSEVEDAVDRVGIVRDGELVVVERVEKLKQKARRVIELHFAGPVPEGPFAALPGVETVRIMDGVGQFVVEGSLDSLVKVAARFEVTNVVSHEADLEDIFLTYYRAEGAEEDAS